MPNLESMELCESLEDYECMYYEFYDVTVGCPEYCSKYAYTGKLYYKVKTFPNYENWISFRYKFPTEYIDVHEEYLGIIHKPCGQIFGHFDPSSPFLWTILLNKVYEVL